MVIRFLEFKFFRNLAPTQCRPAADFNVLWGHNAQGKTNFLEAIYLLGILKSFRTQRNEELIAAGTNLARLRGELLSAAVARQVELLIEPQQKRIHLDGKRVKKAGEILGVLRPVLFSPDEVNLVKGSPGGRRDFIDRALLQADPTYLERIQDYLRILRQRNRLLRQGAPERDLAPWSESLAVSGARIYADRRQFVAQLLPQLQSAYARITEAREQAALHCPASAADEDAEQLRTKLHRLAREERRLGQTLVGPHREDPQFLVDGRNLRAYGSQGQQRCFILAFKAAQIEHLEQTTGESPVLLLDDITSELDSRRKSYLFEFLRERRGQVFLTTTDAEPLRREGLAQARFFHVKRGQLHDE
ncbi:DNA replication/repair protein RecF [Geoalkalibacter halelectricus]|uniref:DNA replication and repair protein RecF n=1 Tax=Geoalkalibacter halelectricus TaxID=2847045 RepID=A0ABY5ZGQ3_9BACT|nr:DNA replication/repair protein RecF [Geoalkalibacter halelectricus]MDO3378211.1 DNA replication/repair protein RecF [Geoalkalibacter halelectricus]UWZ78054.1 DNA replication/repair protein RecF [Geoalkalibacter halelectricus]